MLKDLEISRTYLNIYLRTWKKLVSKSMRLIPRWCPSSWKFQSKFNISNNLYNLFYFRIKSACESNKKQMEDMDVSFCFIFNNAYFHIENYQRT